MFQSHPAVLTLVSVFEGFRMTKKVDQMADSFFELAEILEFPYSKMFEDMIRASLLIMVNFFMFEMVFDFFILWMRMRY